jgi:ribosome-associated protein
LQPSCTACRVRMPLSLEKQRQLSLEEACLCAKVADDFRGSDTVVLDLTAITPLVDFFVITTGSNPRQMRSLAEEVRTMMKSRGRHSRGIEGEGENAWLLLDFGDIVLHVFDRQARELYDLERLWADAKRVDWRLQRPTPASVSSTPA